MAQFNWNGRKLVIKRSEYQYGSCKQLAILAFDNDDDECCEACGIPYGVLTVNLDDPRCEPPADGKYGKQFLDVNNWPAIEWLLKHDESCDWAEPTGYKCQSGFVTYPIWVFDLEKIPHV